MVNFYLVSTQLQINKYLFAEWHIVLISDSQLLSVIYLEVFGFFYYVKVFYDHVYPNRVLI